MLSYSIILLLIELQESFGVYSLALDLIHELLHVLQNFKLFLSGKYMFQERAFARFYAYDGLNTASFSFKSTEKTNLYRHLLIDVPGPTKASECRRYYRNKLKSLIQLAPHLA